MTEQLQLRRGTATQVAAFTGAQGEVVVDTTNNRIVVGDGATPGGFAAAKISGDTLTDTNLVNPAISGVSGGSALWTAQQFYGAGSAASNKLKTYAYGDNATNIVSLSQSGQVGIAGASWASLANNDGDAPIGVLFFGFADGAGPNAAYPASAGYGEGRSLPGSVGYCVALELDSTNCRGSTVNISPVVPFEAGNDLALHLAAGGSVTSADKGYDPANGLFDLVSGPSSAAVLISGNGSTFNKGIVFDEEGLSGADGTDSGGNAEAISFGRGHYQAWYASNGAVKAKIGSTLQTTDPNQALEFLASQGLIYSSAAGALVQVYPGTSGTAAEGILILIGAAGGNNPPTIKPMSADGQSNLDLLIEGLGTGIVRLGSPAATPAYTVSALPAASAALKGARACVTDATSPTFLGALTGGGSVVCPVFCNGSAWVAG